MSAWDDLVAAALLGSDRAPIPGLADGHLGALASQLDGERPERRLLASAALVSLWRQAGARPMAASPIAPAAVPAGERPCPAEAAAHLGEILNGAMGLLLGEWLRTLASAGYTLPHRWLPELLDVAAPRPELHPLVEPVLGERGRWLAALKPAWEGLAARPRPAAAGEAWQTGSREARLALLQALRAADPARARELVASTWHEDSPAERAAFLAALATGLGPDDEPFLEEALDDRRHEVRAAAADLLARLPGSRLVARMQERLRPLLVLEKGLLGRQRVQVNPPESFDPALARDGVAEARANQSVARRVWWLMQMLAAVPPATWSRAWDKSADEIAALVAKDEQRGPLLEALAVAAGRYSDAEWARAVLRQWQAAPWPSSVHRDLGALPDVERCLALVPQQSLEGWLIPGLHPGDEPDDAHAINILAHHRRPWGQALTRAFVQMMRDSAGRLGQGGRSYGYHPVSGLACYASPAAAADAEQGWPEGVRRHQEMDRFLAILHFRRDMLQALR